MSECWKFKVEGRVQGDWVRDSTRRQAEVLELSGHAINCPDGSVEVLACGEPESLEVLSDWLHHGPPMARVKSVSRIPFSGSCPNRYKTG